MHKHEDGQVVWGDSLNGSKRDTAVHTKNTGIDSSKTNWSPKHFALDKLPAATGGQEMAAGCRYAPGSRSKGK